MTLMAAPRKPSRLSHLGALRVVNPEQRAKKIKQAMKEHGGRIPDAAGALDISVRQLFRWLQDPVFEDLPRAPPGVHRDEE